MHHASHLKAATTLIATFALFACSPGDLVPTPADTTMYSPADLNVIAASEPTARLAYAGEAEVQTGDLRVPEGRGPFPVAMLVHGGCWNNLGLINNMGPLADWLAENGVASWNVDYRELKTGGGWPQTFVDWAGALSQLQTLAASHALDLERITVIGHSSGTLPAVWLGMEGRGDAIVSDNIPDVRAAVTLDGPLSLNGMSGVQEDICSEPVVSQLMGGTPEDVPERYAMVEPGENDFALEEMLVVVGSLPLDFDTPVAAIAGQGVKVTRIDLDGRSHFNLLVPGTADFGRIEPDLLRVAQGK